MWNNDLWMSIQDGTNKTVTTTRVSNEQDKHLHAIVQRLELFLKTFYCNKRKKGFTST